MNLDTEAFSNYKLFPTTRYQGSKRRLLPWLYKIFNQLEFDTILDAFGGSASASYLLKLMDKTVYFNDILKSNYQTGMALIENNNIKLGDTDIDFLLQKSDQAFPTFIADTFEDIYFYHEENEWLDMMIFNIKALASMYDGEILVKKQALALHSLFQACLSKRPFNLFHRKNLYIRQADVTRTFGNKRTWDVDFPTTFRKFAQETSSKVFSNNKANKAYCMDVLDLEKVSYDLVYLDPPYQRPSETHPQDYFSMYHFLDGLVDYENWFSKIDLSKKHKPLIKNTTKLDNLSPLDRMSSILEKFQASKIAISYGTPGIPTVEELVSLVKKYKRTVKIFDTEYSYKLNKRNGHKLREIVIIGS